MERGPLGRAANLRRRRRVREPPQGRGGWTRTPLGRVGSIRAHDPAPRQRVALQLLGRRAVTSVAVVAPLLFSLALAAPAEAGAPDPTASTQAEADRLISEGLELRRGGKSREAVDLFRRAHTLAFTPRALGQLALAEASAQIWVDAETHLVSTLEL